MVGGEGVWRQNMIKWCKSSFKYKDKNIKMIGDGLKFEPSNVNKTTNDFVKCREC